MKRAILSIFAICLLIPFLGCAQQKTKAMYHKISAEEAKKMLDENPGALLLDVRSEAEYNEKHIPGATLFPLPDIASKAAIVLPAKNALILVYCRSGMRSMNAANQLASMGYTNVYDIGGINSWPYDTE